MRNVEDSTVRREDMQKIPEFLQDSLRPVSSHGELRQGTATAEAGPSAVSGRKRAVTCPDHLSAVRVGVA